MKYGETCGGSNITQLLLHQGQQNTQRRLSKPINLDANLESFRQQFNKYYFQIRRQIVVQKLPNYKILIFF